MKEPFTASGQRASFTYANDTRQANSDATFTQRMRDESGTANSITLHARQTGFDSWALSLGVSRLFANVDAELPAAVSDAITAANQLAAAAIGSLR